MAEPSMVCDGVEMRPHPKARRRGSAASRAVPALAFFASALAYSARFDDTAVRTALVGGGMLGGLALGLAVHAWYRSFRLRIDELGLVVTTAFRRRNVTRSHPITRIVEADVDFGRFTGPLGHFWIFVDSTGRCVLRIYPRDWDSSDLQRLRDALGVPIDVHPGRVTAAALRREVRGALPWWEAHLVIFTLLVITGITVVVLVARA